MDATTVTRDLSSLKKFSIKRDDDELTKHLNAKLRENGGKVLVHAKCRCEYINDKRKKRHVTMDTTNGTPKKKKLSSRQPNFDWKNNCLFCDDGTAEQHRKEKIKDGTVRIVGGKLELVELTDKTRTRCLEQSDAIASTVLRRLSDCLDLVVSEARYHILCHICFFQNDLSVNKHAGRSNTSTMQEAFDEIYTSLQTDSELFTLDEVRDKMVKEYGADVYTEKRIKKKLQERYKENIFFAKFSGQKNAVCFKKMAELIISDKWYSDRKSDKAYAARIIMEWSLNSSNIASETI